MKKANCTIATTQDIRFPTLVIILYRKVKLATSTIYRLCSGSSETVSFFLPFLRRAASTRLPFLVAIRLLKPCLFLRLRIDG